jgi:hypothetical protein
MPRAQAGYDDAMRSKLVMQGIAKGEKEDQPRTP